MHSLYLLWIAYLRFGIIQPTHDGCHDQHSDIHEIVLPSNGAKCDWIDEGVEEDRKGC